MLPMNMMKRAALLVANQIACHDNIASLQFNTENTATVENEKGDRVIFTVESANLPALDQYPDDQRIKFLKKLRQGRLKNGKRKVSHTFLY